MRNQAKRLITAYLAAICLLLGVPAYAVVTVQVKDSAGNPVGRQTITLKIPGKPDKKVQTASDGTFDLPEEDEDDRKALMIFLADGRQGTYDLVGGGGPLKWLIGAGAVAGIAIAADSGGGDSSPDPLSAENVSSGDTSSGDSGGSDTGASDSGGSDTGGGDSGGGSTGGGNGLSAGCTIEDSIGDGVIEMQPDPTGDALTVTELGDDRLEVVFNGPVLQGTVTLQCEVDDIGYFNCEIASGSVTMGGESGVGAVGGFDINDANDGFARFGLSFFLSDVINIGTSGFCNG